MTLKNRLAGNLNWIMRRPSAGGPFRAVVEISNACNLRCVMCPRNEMTRPVRFMTLDEFTEVIRRNHTDLEFVSLNGYGEPLLHRQLIEMVQVCKQHGIPTGISTNCTRLDAARTEALLDCEIDLVILAIDGVNPESYGRIRVGADFESVCENARHFLNKKRRRKAPTFTILQCIAMDETRETMAAFRKHFVHLKPDAFRLRQLAYTGDHQQDESFVNDRTCCYWPWIEPMILSDGRITACCQDVNANLVIGNAFEQTLREAWAGQAIARLRKAHATGNRQRIPVCAACNMVQPSRLQALGGMCFPTGRLNRLLPFVESTLATWRYR